MVEEEYCPAKRRAKSVSALLRRMLKNRKAIFKFSCNLTGDKQDIVGEKCKKKDDGSITFSDADKLTAWKDHYMRLLNVEFY